MKRVPLWLTVVPLVLAVAGYWWAWTGWRDDFRAEIARVLPGAPVSIGGFPYRLEAEVGQPVLQAKSDITASATARLAIVNRGPWQKNPTIIRSVEPRIVAQIPALAGSALSIVAPSAETSLHVEDGRIARLSTVLTAATIDLQLLGLPLAAARFEVHIRETPGRSAEAWSPTLPQRAQVVLAGEGIHAPGGAPLKLAADLRVTGPTRLVDYAGWAPKGTVEIHPLIVSDATGEVLRLQGTLVASTGTPHVSATVTTECPLTVQAAFTGGRVSEQRLRLPVTLSLSGTPGAWQLGGLPEPGRATRAQQPPCPVLR